MNYLSPEFEDVSREDKPEVDRPASTATLTPELAGSIMREHFANVSDEDFLRRVEQAGPWLLQHELPLCEE